jgi:hypothetical protein
MQANWGMGSVARLAIAVAFAGLIVWLLPRPQLTSFRNEHIVRSQLGQWQAALRSRPKIGAATIGTSGSGAHPPPEQTLIWDHKVIVASADGEAGYVNLAVFNLNAAGEQAYQYTHQLRTSWHKALIRQAGNKLIVYGQRNIAIDSGLRDDSLPAQRRMPNEFLRIADASKLYRLRMPLQGERDIALHSVTVCDLSQAQLDCRASGVFAHADVPVYPSAQAVYLYSMEMSSLLRLPLDGSEPRLLQVQGRPVNPSAIHERGGYLYALMSAGAGTSLSLLQLPTAEFSRFQTRVKPEHYRTLPSQAEEAEQIRYVDHYLLYGAGTTLNIADVRARTPVQQLPLAHAIVHIEPSADGVTVSDGSGAEFSVVRLAPTPAVLAHLHRTR